MNLSQLDMTPEQIAQYQALGIKEMGIATNADGISISLNGKTLPYITWADGRINNVLNLAKESGLLSMVPGLDPSQLDMVTELLPAITASTLAYAWFSRNVCPATS